jgi:hypothetical protein
VATAVALLVQLTGRPVSAFPDASRALAVSACVPPTARLAVAGETLTDATGTWVTSTAAVPFTPSTVAVMVALPAATAVTTPSVLTVATAGALLAHVTWRPVSALPAASRALAVSCCVPPTTSVVVTGDTVTAATGAVATVTVAEPVTPSTVAVMVEVPAATAVTTPCALTVATEAALLVHDTARPVKAFPDASRALAVNCWVAPTTRLAAAGETDTAATGTSRTVAAAVAVNVVVPKPVPDPVQVKVKVAEPGATPVTTPAPVTVATDGVDELYP